MELYYNQWSGLNANLSFYNRLFTTAQCTEPYYANKTHIQKYDLEVIFSARLAQSVERWTLNPTVVGSSPTLGDLFFGTL